MPRNQSEVMSNAAKAQKDFPDRKSSRIEAPRPAGASLLEIEDLRVRFGTRRGLVRAVDGVSLRLERGEVLGIVGESGSGKSVLSLSILQLLPSPPAIYAGGRIGFDGEDLLSLSKADMRALRGNRISMIFQEPMTALNPVFTIGHQIAEVFRVHRGLSKGEAREAAVEMLATVGVPAPASRARDFAFQLSGGMRQRVMIAMALACRPQLLIADEPTTALDVTIQAQILALMADLRDRLGTAIILITHDLGVVAETADRVAVMYAGRIVEEAPVATLFERPLHPYTRALMHAVPRLEMASGERLEEITGTVPNLAEVPLGCRFRDRCPLALESCRDVDPALVEVAPGHRVACLRANDV
jgi:peptide/nickel transport system ATP-binding protein/oligopeptide transport system ATP-binding protein